MPEQDEVLQILKSSYPMGIDRVEFNRDGGSLSYVVLADGKKFFLRVIRPELMKTALQSVDIQLYLAGCGFPVPAVIRTRDNAPHVRTAGEDGEHLYVLYEYLEGEEPKRVDAEDVGKLVGQLHRSMLAYPGKLPVCEKPFFIDRYVAQLRKKQYPRAEVFGALGNELWSRVKDLPRGYCHCDLYRGNVHKTAEGALYILDFDTSCNAFPMYDVVLFCNETDYFKFEESGFGNTKNTLEKFLKGYLSCNALSQMEIASFGELLAVYHFQVQATILEIYGLGCVDEDFVDRQLDWLKRWENQCRQGSWL